MERATIVRIILSNKQSLGASSLQRRNSMLCTKYVRSEILALSLLLEELGPQLGRPRVDTLNGSRHATMKELRFSATEGK
jgi:hypothetical protein